MSTQAPDPLQATKRSTLDDKAQLPAPGLLREFWYFLSHNKKWWMLPLILMILLLGAFVMFSGTAAATMIYTLF